MRKINYVDYSMCNHCVVDSSELSGLKKRSIFCSNENRTVNRSGCPDFFK